MVERTKSEGFDEFVGVVENVILEPSNLTDGGEQYHLTMKPEGVEITGKTGLMHEWIRVPPKATETSVPEGSVLDKFVQELEVLHNEVKKLGSVPEIFAFLVGKKYLFKKKKLGKSFDGHEAKAYWVPVSFKE